MAEKRGFFTLFGSSKEEEPITDTYTSSVEADMTADMQEIITADSTEEPVQMSEDTAKAKRVSDESRRRQQILIQMRNDVRTFDEELARSELVAEKTRQHLERFTEFFQEAESELEIVSGLKADLAERNNTVQQLTLRTQRVEETLADREALLAAEQNRIIELRDLLEAARAKASALSESSQASSQEIVDLVRVRDELESRSSSLNNRVTDLSAELRILGESKERLERDNARLAEENVEHEAHVLELERTQTQIVAQRDRSANELQERNNDIAELRADLLEFRSRTTSLEQELASQERHGQARLRSREEEVTSLKSEIENLHSQVTVRTHMFQQAQDAMNSAKAAAKVARDTADEMEARLVASNISREDDQRDLLNRSNEIVEMNSRIMELVNRLEVSELENDQLRKVQKIYDDRLREANERDEALTVFEQSTEQVKEEVAKSAPGRKRKLQ